MVQFTTAPYEILLDPPDTLLQEVIQATIDEAIYPLACAQCRSNQNFSRQEASRFRQEAEQRLTVEWLRDQIAHNL